MRLRAGGRGKGSTLVTLKSTEAQPEGAVFSRDEYQLKVKDLDSATWPEGEVRNMVEQIGGGQPLTEVVTITQTRQVSILYEGERAVAEMSVDEVKIPTQGEPVNDYELEVEMLPGGLDADLRILTRILAEDFNLIPQPLSKFERALQIASPNGSERPHTDQATDQESTQASSLDGGRPTVKLDSEPAAPSKAPKQPKAEKPAKAEKADKAGDTGDALEASEADSAGKKDEMGVRGTDSMGAAGRKIIGTYFRAMVDNEDGTRAGEDPEALHDMRVATRRMRAALTVLEPYLESARVDRVRRGLRDVTRALGTVRDHDVLIGKAQGFREKLPEDQQTDLDGLIEAWQDERDKGRIKLMDLLDSKEYERFK